MNHMTDKILYRLVRIAMMVLAVAAGLIGLVSWLFVLALAQLLPGVA